MEYIKEIRLNKYSSIISYECTENILEQMNKNIFKIKIGEGQGTGFSCRIPFPDKNNMLSVFITNNHVINKEILDKYNNEIEFYIREENKKKKINIRNRKVYMNKNYDITIIEIKKEDGIKNYLELDDKILNEIIYNNNKNFDYIDEEVYIIHYPKGKLSVSYGVIESILEEKNFNFNHKCSTEEGSSGSPILNIHNNKLIGIHKQGIQISNHRFNRGAFLNYPIKEFIKINYKLKGEEPIESFKENKHKTNLNKGITSFLISTNNNSKYGRLIKEPGNIDQKSCETLVVRKLPNISLENYEKLKASIADIDALSKLCDDINSINCNFKSVDPNNSLGGLTPLSYLVESSFSMDTYIYCEIKNKYNKLKPYIYNYRNINNDGNCFYRAVMFRFLEILVLNRQIKLLQNLIYDIYNSFNSEELKSRLSIGKINLKPDLTLKLLIIILDILKKDNISAALKLLIRSFSICRKFDYSIIFYFRYILYDYIKKNIKKNEGTIYIKSTPIKLCNLLSSEYITKDGVILYESFYQNDLLKFFTVAKKIVIYVTPFVIGIPLNIINYEEENLQQFKSEEGQGLNLPDEINLMSIKNNYCIIYTNKDNEKYKHIFENYENKPKSLIS